MLKYEIESKCINLALPDCCKSNTLQLTDMHLNCCQIETEWSYSVNMDFLFGMKKNPKVSKEYQCNIVIQLTATSMAIPSKHDDLVIQTVWAQRSGKWLNCHDPYLNVIGPSKTITVSLHKYFISMNRRKRTQLWQMNCSNQYRYPVSLLLFFFMQANVN